MEKNFDANIIVACDKKNIVVEYLESSLTSTVGLFLRK